MAKVNIEFDTNDKSLSIKLDGKTLEDVDYVSLSKVMDPYGGDGDGDDDEDEYRMTICMCSSDDEHDIKKHTSVHASENLAFEYTSAVNRAVLNCFQ